jgi:hypothetical protein
MKNKFWLLLLLVLFFFLSCKNEKPATETTEDQIPVIDVEKALNHLSNQPFNFSEFVEDITYIPLQTTEQSLVGSRRQPPLHVSENFIFYGETMFKRDGRFVRKLGKIGQGPEEYTLALGMAVDEKRQEFYVYSNDSRNIYVYNFDNRFLRKIQAPNRGRFIASIGNGKIILLRDGYGFMRGYYDDFYEYRVIDTDTGEILYTRNSGVTENDKIHNLMNSVWCYNKDVFYFESATDTIFRLNENGEIDTPRYLINRGKNKDPDSENFLSISGFVESNQYLFFSAGRRISLNPPRSDPYYGAYNKQTGEIVINKFDEFFNNDIDGGFLWLFKGTADGSEGFYSVLPHIAKERIETLSNRNKGYNSEKNQKLRQLIDCIDEEDNDIFYFLKLK